MQGQMSINMDLQVREISQISGDKWKGYPGHLQKYLFEFYFRSCDRKFEYPNDNYSYYLIDFLRLPIFFVNNHDKYFFHIKNQQKFSIT